MDDPDPVRQAGHFSQDVAGHENRDALFPGQLKQEFTDLNDPGRVQTVGWLVQKDQFWIVQQGFGQPQALGIAHGRGTCPPVRVCRQTQALDHLADSFPFCPRMKTPGNFQVLTDGQLGVGVRHFHQVPDFSPGFPAAQADPLPKTVALPRVGLIIPNSMRMVVVFPAPFKPRKA